MLNICAVACLFADPDISIWFRIRVVDDQTKIRRKNVYIDKYKAKKVVGETKMDAWNTKDDQHSRNDKSVVIELILNQACMLPTVKIFIEQSRC